ncbi:MAG: lipocalin family protein [Bacteroidales bacterium]|nr:lipocalin family protein [Bacteroidales bacterium]
MKKLTFFISLIFVTLNITSCDVLDELLSGKNLLYGEWGITTIYYEEGTTRIFEESDNKIYLIFNKDGSFEYKNSVISSKDNLPANSNITKSTYFTFDVTGTYKYDTAEKTITISFKSDNDEELKLISFDVEDLTADRLLLEYSGLEDIYEFFPLRATIEFQKTDKN